MPTDNRPQDPRISNMQFTIRQKLLLSVAGVLRKLPNFRGKVRSLLALHNVLGLDVQHTLISTRLQRPVPFNVSLDLHCKHERMAFFMDEYDADAIEFLLRLVEPGEAFLDIGANIGLIAIPFTILSKSSGSTSIDAPFRTYCIEAVPANAQALRANITNNGLAADISVIDTAVGECEKTVTIDVELNANSTNFTGTANILPAGNSDPRNQQVELKVTTIDQLVATGRLTKNCGLVKIDTDGYDLFALQGAEQFIKNSRPIIFGEFDAHCLNWHGQSIADVERFFSPLGYRVLVRRKGWTFEPRKEGAPFRQDVICAPEEKLSRLKWCLV